MRFLLLLTRGGLPLLSASPLAGTLTSLGPADPSCTALPLAPLLSPAAAPCQLLAPFRDHLSETHQTNPNANLHQPLRELSLRALGLLLLCHPLLHVLHYMLH